MPSWLNDCFRSTMKYLQSGSSSIDQPQDGMSGGWLEEYSAALNARDEREKAGADIIDAYTCLAARMVQQQRESREKEIKTEKLIKQLQQQQQQQQPGQSLPKPPREAQLHHPQPRHPQQQQQQQQQQTSSPRHTSWLSHDISSKDIPRQPTPPQSPSSTSLETERLTKFISALRLDLSTSQLCREDLERKAGTLEAEVKELKELKAQSEMLFDSTSAERALLQMRLKDMDEEITGKDELRNNIQTEVASLTLELNMVEGQNRELREQKRKLMQYLNVGTEAEYEDLFDDSDLDDD